MSTFFRFVEDQDSFPPAISRERSVSVSVNRANYSNMESGETLYIQPVGRNLYQIPWFKDLSAKDSTDNEICEMFVEAKE